MCGTFETRDAVRLRRVSALLGHRRGKAFLRMHFLRLEADLLSRLQRKQELSPHGWLLTPVRNANRFEQLR